MWRIPAPLIAGSGETLLYFNTDEWIGDLWTYLGSPALPVDVVITADGADVGGIYISANFSVGSTFTCIAENNGRFIGAGGDGGDGGDDNGAILGAAGDGTDGGHAIASEGFDVDIDIDNGFLLGGGGGGGGGAGVDFGATTDAGGGGGGGIGFTGEGGAAGLGGSGSTPSAGNGTAGTSIAAGAGGAGGGVSAGTAIGGAGGAYGDAGSRGYHEGDGNLRAGTGGHAGNAFSPVSGTATLNYIGSLTEANLRAAGQLLGETVGLIRLHALRTDFVTSAGSATLGFRWQSDGELEKVSNSSIQSGYYWRDTENITGLESNFVNTNFEILRDSVTRTNTWDATTNFATEDVWTALTGSPLLTITSTGFKDAEQMVQIRRTVASGGSGNPLAMGFYGANKEDFS